MWFSEHHDPDTIGHRHHHDHRWGLRNVPVIGNKLSWAAQKRLDLWPQGHGESHAACNGGALIVTTKNDSTRTNPDGRKISTFDSPEAANQAFKGLMDPAAGT